MRHQAAYSLLHRLLPLSVAMLLGPMCARAETLNWQQVKDRFHQNNPALQAGQTFVSELRANEITAGLRPNPVFTSSNDQLRLNYDGGPVRPLSGTQLTQTLAYLHERQHKRDLRASSARLATAGGQTDLADLDRQLTFTVRDAFVRVLQGKATLQLAQDNLSYYDRIIEVNRQRLQAGDVSDMDFTRVALQRAQFESDLANAQVTVRTAKIALLALLNDKQPLDSFDVDGDFDFHEITTPPEEVRQIALSERPDLLSAVTATKKADNDHRLAIANGAADPTIFADYVRLGPANAIGMGFSIPLRVFDKNQGEKARTQLEMHRTEQIRVVVETNLLRDVDSAYASLPPIVSLCRSYKNTYLLQASNVRDKVSFAYRNGGATLLDFLDAQKSYRDTQLAYRNLIASYLSAVNQLNLAVGREVIP
jgi:cobalt-zinc-cadmium efflux system outer membrane protein